MFHLDLLHFQRNVSNVFNLLKTVCRRHIFESFPPSQRQHAPCTHRENIMQFVISACITHTEWEGQRAGEHETLENWNGTRWCTDSMEMKRVKYFSINYLCCGMATVQRIWMTYFKCIENKTPHMYKYVHEPSKVSTIAEENRAKWNRVGERRRRSDDRVLQIETCRVRNQFKAWDVRSKLAHSTLCITDRTLLHTTITTAATKLRQDKIINKLQPKLLRTNKQKLWCAEIVCAPFQSRMLNGDHAHCMRTHREIVDYARVFLARQLNMTHSLSDNFIINYFYVSKFFFSKHCFHFVCRHGSVVVASNTFTPRSRTIHATFDCQQFIYLNALAIFLMVS